MYSGTVELFRDTSGRGRGMSAVLSTISQLVHDPLVSMEGIVGDSAKSIQSIVDRDTNVARKYGYPGGLRWNAISAAEIFEPVLVYWEKRVDTNKSMLERLLGTGVLLELMNLFVHMNRDEFYSTHVSVECKSCLGKLCTVKRDLYNAVVMKCRFISLVCKFPVKTAGESVRCY
ncbi:PREDICTED: uncharacterized protein LOC105560740 [Vollenhovia emeryi]|uniref:uncharacterized protein LOC105560740 n=1 Tax=Vollenhovia emeryi TaxID=411798 RepID=UPI0005F4BA51|nr:PREDICTED: uncharacterized protein LOC105560740 [Vollenhovia emeryi]